ncbi:MAG: formylglycine-generating enzyme family protein [Lewinellaceae bacterium]|nr:formylglycine-generating enzyme family protein [Lewinellaceae bacterium]
MFVEGGAFQMGDEKGDLWEVCRPVHPVSVSSFYIGKYQVTQAIWQTVMGENPSGFKGETLNVGLLLANELDVYDMSGNLWEWCMDTWHDTYHGAPHDGSAWVDLNGGESFVVRGGSYFDAPLNCRTTYRSKFLHDDSLDNIGFRLCLPIPASH